MHRGCLLAEVRREPLGAVPAEVLPEQWSTARARLDATEWMEGAIDSEAFLRTLFRFYYRPIYYFFVRRGFSPHDSEDLAQETYLQVCRGLKTFQHESSLDAWIFTIAQNVLRKTVRRSHTAKRRGSVISLDTDEDQWEAPPQERLSDPRSAESTPLHELLHEEQRTRLLRTVAEMPDQMRRCALLRYDRGLKYREIAVVLQLSIQTVKSHLFQARERLKATLSEES